MPASHHPVIPVLLDAECASIPSLLSIVNSIQKTAAKKGLPVKVFPDCDTLLQSTDPIHTIILTGFASPKMYDILDILRAAEKQVVITNVDTDHIDARYSCVSFSRRLGTEYILDFLVQRGSRSVALLGCGVGSSNDDLRAHAVKTYMEQNRIVRGECFYYTKEIIESFNAFLHKREEFDTVLCTNTYVAVAFLRFCEDHQLRIPDQFSLACLKDGHICRCCSPSITALSENTSLIGEQALVVWHYLESAPSNDARMRIALKGNIIERESTASLHSAEVSTPSSSRVDAFYEGGPFYQDQTIRQLMSLERCLSQCDELDLRIIDLLLQGLTYEKIAEILFLSTSTLQYRINKFFQLTGAKGKNQFLLLFQEHFTRSHHFSS